jgi:RNA polymerase sigma-70 factor, ECF subfamily
MSAHPLAAASGPALTILDDESRLIARVIAGDRRAARAIYEAHVAAIFRLAARMVGPEMAEECTQDAFVRAFERIGTFRRESALRTWLHSITVSVALNLIRRERRRRSHLSIDLVPDVSCETPESDPLLSRRISKAIDALDPDLRMVVVLNLIEGRSHIEIGEMLGIPEGTSKARLSRARARLREALADVAPAVA